MGLRVLVADDDIVLCLLVSEVLRRDGHTVTTVGNGEQALDAAFAAPPDVAVLDVMMPGLDGYRVARALRQDPRTAHVPVIVLTARAGGMDRDFAFTSGATGFLRKPFDRRELSKRVRSAAAAPAAA